MRFTVFVAASLAVIAGCVVEEVDGEQPVGELETRTGTFELYGTTAELPYVVRDDGALLHDDIVLGYEDERAGGLGTTSQEIVGVSRGKLWENGVIPYVIDTNLPAGKRSAVNNAMNAWMNRTGNAVRFVKRNGHADYVVFGWRPGMSDPRCTSRLGRVGGQQFIEIGPDCTQSNVVHEIGHTLGLWHEHQRPGRGTWIKIFWNRIPQYRQHAYVEAKDAVYVFGNAMDFSSIMMYGSFAGATSYSAPIMTRIDGSTWETPEVISSTDAKHVQWLYNQNVACEVQIDSCPAYPEKNGIWFFDHAGTEYKNRCLNRPKEWLLHCGSAPQTKARSRFYWKQTSVANADLMRPACMITMNAGQCPRAPQWATQFVDAQGSASPTKCQQRLEAWYDYCDPGYEIAAYYWHWDISVTSYSYP